MAKYHDLVKKYARDINSIKRLEAEATDLRARANAVQVLLEAPFEGLDEAQDLSDQADDIYSGLNEDYGKLEQDIEREYWDTPFKATREAGIEGFWREAGLSAR